jgi:hypothetical protein
MSNLTVHVFPCSKLSVWPFCSYMHYVVSLLLPAYYLNWLSLSAISSTISIFIWYVITYVLNWMWEINLIANSFVGVVWLFSALSFLCSTISFLDLIHPICCVLMGFNFRWHNDLKHIPSSFGVRKRDF